MTAALLRRCDAAAHLGCGDTKFDQLRREDPGFPLPVWIDSDPRWSTAELDAWVATLPRSATKPTEQRADRPVVRHRRSRNGDADLSAAPTPAPLRAVT